METGLQHNLTNFGSFAGKSSPDDNRNSIILLKLPAKVFLHSQESRHLTNTFYCLEQVWQIGTEWDVCLGGLFYFFCHIYDNIALCIDFFYILPPPPNPQINMGGILESLCMSVRPSVYL